MEWDLEFSLVAFRVNGHLESEAETVDCSLRNTWCLQSNKRAGAQGLQSRIQAVFAFSLAINLRKNLLTNGGDCMKLNKWVYLAERLMSIAVSGAEDPAVTCLFSRLLQINFPMPQVASRFQWHEEGVQHSGITAVVGRR